MALIISDKVLDKLGGKHSVTQREVEHCFENREGGFATDVREDHATDPPTLWFVAPTNQGRWLKIMFVQDGGDIYLKSAYDATPEIIRIYNKYAS